MLVRITSVSQSWGHGRWWCVYCGRQSKHVHPLWTSSPSRSAAAPRPPRGPGGSNIIYFKQTNKQISMRLYVYWQLVIIISDIKCIIITLRGKRSDWIDGKYSEKFMADQMSKIDSCRLVSYTCWKHLHALARCVCRGTCPSPPWVIPLRGAVAVVHEASHLCPTAWFSWGGSRSKSPASHYVVRLRWFTK